MLPNNKRFDKYKRDYIRNKSKSSFKLFILLIKKFFNSSNFILFELNAF